MFKPNMNMQLWFQVVYLLPSKRFVLDFCVDWFHMVGEAYNRALNVMPAARKGMFVPIDQEISPWPKDPQSQRWPTGIHSLPLCPWTTIPGE